MLFIILNKIAYFYQAITKEVQIIELDFTRFGDCLKKRSEQVFQSNQRQNKMIFINFMNNINKKLVKVGF